MDLRKQFFKMKANLNNSWSALWQDKTDYRDAYSLDFDISEVSEDAISSAKSIRGIDRPATIMVFGVAPRSGTNYIGNVISNHPDVSAYPNEIYEVPFLRITNKLKSFQDAFFDDYYRNIENMNKNDFLPLFGSSFIAHLYSYIPKGKTMLVKEPDTRFLRYFPYVFPHEHLLLVLRDGRDVVDSTIRTWPSMDFKKICQRWSDSTKLILKFQRKYNERYLLIKYEDMLDKPKHYMTNILMHYKLDVDSYPFEKIESMPIVGSSTASKKGDEVSWKPIPASKSFKPTNKWNNWTAKQKNDFKTIAGEALIEAKYCNGLDW